MPYPPGRTATASAGSNGRIDTLGAITASAPNQSPVSAAGGGRPSRLVASPMARSTWGAPPRSPSRSILPSPAWQISAPADVAHGCRGRQLVGIAHRVEVGDLAVDDLNGENTLQVAGGVDQHRRRGV